MFQYFTEDLLPGPNPLKLTLSKPRLERKMSDVSHMPDAVLLGAEDLPAYCPNPAMPLWSSHPRVYLELDHHGEAKCPYCGTSYKLKPGTVVKGH
jgi:uncharacterized Zn-finger protein